MAEARSRSSTGSAGGRGLQAASLAAAVSVFALIVLGGVVRVTGSGLGCPDWPLCYGQLIPPPRLDAWLEYSHRLAASLASLFIALTTILALRQARRAPAFAWIAVGTALLLGVQIGLGALTVLLETPPEVVAVHLGLALLIQALLIVLAVEARAPVGARFAADTELARSGIATALTVFLLLVSGALTRGSGASLSCAGWPLCDGQVWPSHMLGQVHMLHRLVALVGGGMVIAFAVRVTRTPTAPAAARGGAVLAALLLPVQAGLGAWNVLAGLPPLVNGLHVATAAALWGVLVAAVVLLSRRPGAEGAVAAPPQGLGRGRPGDYLALTKPAILALLLVTTLAGMIVAAGGWPATSLVFWTLLGGALSAGGASALNQYTDRETDGRMTRTQRRPLPAGRLSPEAALTFGLVLTLAGFYVLALAVNLLSALLALAGALYYVVLYGLVLKRTTPQNIVVGGGAGAIPPLVGWAAATGTLDMQSFLLFALVFFWTPAHFWALALVRRLDYARAGIPMLPVVAGERETRAQILLYTVQVVVVTLLIGALAREGLLYFGLATVLGVWLLAHAWRLWRLGTARLAWRMYRFSSMYLALVLAALVLDTLIGL